MKYLISALAIATLLAITPIAYATDSTVTIPQCDPPLHAMQFPDGHWDCVYPDGTLPPPELGGPPPEPAPAPAPQQPQPMIDSWSDEVVDVTPTWQYLSTAQGCRTIIASHTAHSFLWGTMFRHNLRVYWCWARGAVLSSSTVCYASEVSPWIVADSCQTQGYYYMWNNNPKGGYDNFSHASYHNCFGGDWGCIFHYDVNVEVFVHGDGTYTTRGGSVL